MFENWIWDDGSEYFPRPANITPHNLATPLYYASLMGLLVNATKQIQQSADITAKGGGAGTALVAAASGGHCDILELFLNNEAKFRPRSFS